MKQLKLPLLKQRGKRDCGIVALQMVLQYYKKEVSVQEIRKRIGGLKSYGVATTSLAVCARSFGLKADCYSFNAKMAQGHAIIKKPSKKDIISFLERGVPVILTVRSFLLFESDPSTQGHFIVMIGYDKGKFVYADPYDGNVYRINEDALLFAWCNNTLNSSAYLLAIYK